MTRAYMPPDMHTIYLDLFGRKLFHVTKLMRSERKCATNVETKETRES